MYPTKSLVLLATLLISVQLIGCAGSGTGGAIGGWGKTRILGKSLSSDYIRTPTLTTSQEEIIAVDLVSVLMQFPDSSPFQTTIQITRSDTSAGNGDRSSVSDSFRKALLDTLTASGYGIQRVDFDQGSHFITYRLGFVDASRGMITATLSLNDLSLTRQYQLKNGEIVPTAAFKVRGAEPQNILVNSGLFRTRSRAVDLPNAVHFVDYTGVRPAYLSTPAKTQVNQNKSHQIDVQRQLLQSKASLFTLSRLSGDSLNQDKAKEFKTHQLLKIKFSGQSLTLGAQNKRAIRTLLMQFDTTADHLVITGCSHGQSLLWDGTESASLARQQRITNELLAHGIPHEQLLERGCFPAEYDAELQPGMVIIAHRKPTAAFL